MGANDERAIKLDKIKFAALAILPVELLDARVDIGEHEQFAIDEIAIRVKGFVWGEELKEQIIEFPRDWWQAFKDRWFPKWLVNLFPVVHTVHHINAEILYPGFQPSMSDREWRMNVHTYSHEAQEYKS